MSPAGITKPPPEPNLIFLGETTAKIRLKFKDDSISDEINVKVKVKELPLYHFAPYSARMKKSYGENDEIDLDKLIAGETTRTGRPVRSWIMRVRPSLASTISTGLPA